jgi:hypothetical protein
VGVPLPLAHRNSRGDKVFGSVVVVEMSTGGAYAPGRCLVMQAAPSDQMRPQFFGVAEEGPDATGEGAPPQGGPQRDNTHRPL